ncbi:Rhodanese-like domain [Dillenia turbinata]|uniref:Rhodanese-like domain n=1 Tax=Dillenia turbinata TaxID=194707 RepID=A0AAN8W887_9MAGN
MAISLSQLYTSTVKQSQTLKPAQRFKKLRPRPSSLQVKAVASGAKQLIQSGKVRAVMPKEAFSLMNFEGFVLLDIRPEWEREKALVSGSLHVPLFVKDLDNSPITLLKKWVHFGYIGLWTGQNFTTINSEFLCQVENAIPDKDAKLLVACGEGLRSMMAASRLHEGGYRNLAWLAGGFNRSREGDFPNVEGNEKLEYATIGGVSYIFLQLLILLQAVGKKDS